jgi:hypothetical protein
MPYFMSIAKPGTGPNFTWMAWWPLLSAGLAALLSIGKDVGYIVWSRKKLFTSFREQAAQTPGQPRFAAVPVLQPAAAPPVVASQS